MKKCLSSLGKVWHLDFLFEMGAKASLRQLLHAATLSTVWWLKKTHKDSATIVWTWSHLRLGTLQWMVVRPGLMQTFCFVASPVMSDCFSKHSALGYIAIPSQTQLWQFLCGCSAHKCFHNKACSANGVTDSKLNQLVPGRRFCRILARVLEFR